MLGRGDWTQPRTDTSPHEGQRNTSECIHAVLERMCSIEMSEGTSGSSHFQVTMMVRHTHAHADIVEIHSTRCKMKSLLHKATLWIDYAQRYGHVPFYIVGITWMSTAARHMLVAVFSDDIGIHCRRYHEQSWYICPHGFHLDHLKKNKANTFAYDIKHAQQFPLNISICLRRFSIVSCIRIASHMDPTAKHLNQISWCTLSLLSDCSFNARHALQHFFNFCTFWNLTMFCLSMVPLSSDENIQEECHCSDFIFTFQRKHHLKQFQNSSPRLCAAP